MSTTGQVKDRSYTEACRNKRDQLANRSSDGWWTLGFTGPDIE